jgi:hypothetical protein
MLYIKSSPWVFKLAIMILDVCWGGKQQVLEGMFVMKVFLAMSVYVVTTVMPSFICSVRNRDATTEYILLTVFALCNAYMLLCWMLSHPSAKQHSAMMVQFSCLHMLYSQFEQLQYHKHLLLFSTMYSYANLAVLMIVVTALSSLSPVNSREDVVMIFSGLFVGELLGCVAYAQFVVSKVVGEIYVKIMNSFLVL